MKKYGMIFLCIYASSLIYSMELAQSVQLSDNNFRIFGENGYVDIEKKIASSVPLLSQIMQQNSLASNDEFSNFTEEDCLFFRRYALIQFESNSKDLEKDAEQKLVDDIKSFDLEALARRTVMIAQAYNKADEKNRIPQGFELAWSHQLNGKKVNLPTIEALIPNNEDLINAIFVFQDQDHLERSSRQENQSILRESSVSPSIPITGYPKLQLVYTPQDEFQQDHSDDKKNDDEAFNMFDAIKKYVSTKWESMTDGKKMFFIYTPAFIVSVVVLSKLVSMLKGR